MHYKNPNKIQFDQAVKELTLRRTFINHLTELAKENKSIFLLVGDVGYNVVESLKIIFLIDFLM